MLSDFFRINMPYGLYVKEFNKIAPFNREYKPIGVTDRTHLPWDEYIDKFNFVRYGGITEKLLKELSHTGEIHNKEHGLKMIWFYKDSTNPMNKSDHWSPYLEKIKRLSKLNIKLDKNR